MQFTIDCNKLLDGLAVVEKAIPGRSSFAPVEGIYAGLKGDCITLCANDLELAIKLVIAGVEGEGEGATVMPKQFVQIAKQLPDSKISVTIQNDRAVIKSGKSQFKLNCANVEGFPLIDDNFVDKPCFEVKGYGLKEMIRKTTFCVAGINASPVFQGVYICNKEGAITCMASDTYRLAWHRKLQVNHKDPFEVIVPGRLLAEVGRIVDDNDSVKVYINNNDLVFVVNDYTISSRLLNGKYPDLERAFPKESKTRVTIDRQSFVDTVSRARLLADKQNEMIDLSVEGVVLGVGAESEIGKMNEELSINVEGEPLKQLFINAKYLLEGVKAFGSDELSIDFHGNMGAVVLKEEGFKYLALPIKNKNE